MSDTTKFDVHVADVARLLERVERGMQELSHRLVPVHEDGMMDAFDLDQCLHDITIAWASVMKAHGRLTRVAQRAGCKVPGTAARPPQIVPLGGDGGR